MLLDLLKNDLSINRYFCEHCAENSISVTIDSAIEEQDILIIKVDNYYNHLVSNPGYSPDCLIIQRCGALNYNLYIVELRNINSPDGFKVGEIVQKFINCLDDFMSQRFGVIFHNQLFNINQIDLLFITDPYHFLQTPEKQLKMEGHKLDVLMSQRIPKFFGKHLYIKHKLPNPSVKKCS